MKNFIVLFREPDGRTIRHSEEEITNHQAQWKKWFEKWGKEGKLNGGSGLTLEGRIIKHPDTEIINGIHKVGNEIVGGFLQLKANDFDEAVEIMKSCPIYEFGGYSEIRELKQ